MKTWPRYAGGLGRTAQTVVWFWSIVRGMETQDRAALLHFATGSSRAPATGFANLLGYNGAPHRFRLQAVPGGPEALPTASTCFNTLRLPQYESEEQLRSKLLLAIGEGNRGGFFEGAVAD